MFILVLLAVAAIILLLTAFAILHAVLGIVFFLVIAGLCAAAAEYVLGLRESVGVTLLIGLIGAALGVILAHLLGLPRFLDIFHVPIVWTIVGSLIVVGVLRLTMGRDRALRRL